MKHFVVLDLEMCNVPKAVRCTGYHRANETIQIGAVLMDENFQKIDEFNSFVKPEFGKLDSFICSLTGITWNNLNKALSFAEVIDKFVNWIPEGDVEMVSWSNTDRYQLAGEMREKKITSARFEELFEHWNDSQALYSEKVKNKRCYSLDEALTACDIPTEGRAHDGYFDAYNTALLFKKLMTEPELKLNAYYQEAKREETSHLSCTLGEMLKGFNFECAIAG